MAPAASGRITTWGNLPRRSWLWALNTEWRMHQGARYGLSTAPVRIQRQRHSGVQVADGSRERFRLTLTSGGTSTMPESPRVRA